MLKKISATIHAYDPYGFMQVSAMQAVTVTLVLFAVNFCFAPFAFGQALQLPIIGIFTTALEKNFNLRIRNVAIYCCMCTLYSFILSSIIEYRWLTVLVVGVVIFGLFILCQRKFPYILGMITLMQVVVYTQLRINLGGNWNIWINYGTSFLLAMAVGISVMCLYPRIYFYRVWLRCFSFALLEFSANLELLAVKSNGASELVFVHFFQMYDYTMSLGYQEHGFAARRVGLRMALLYVHILELAHFSEAENAPAVQELARACQELSLVINQGRTLDYPEFMVNINVSFNSINQNMKCLISEWNRQCLKI
ncbi:MAG TPA: hypothetical protein PLP75_11390 [Burkholderiales bacterium]|nr:hypothetical protein [Burkholderiales bacterium]